MPWACRSRTPSFFHNLKIQVSTSIFLFGRRLREVTIEVSKYKLILLVFVTMSRMKKPKIRLHNFPGKEYLFVVFYCPQSISSKTSTSPMHPLISQEPPIRTYTPPMPHNFYLSFIITSLIIIILFFLMPETQKYTNQ